MRIVFPQVAQALKRILSFWAKHFKDIFRMISHKHPVNKNLINLNLEIIYEIY